MSVLATTVCLSAITAAGDIDFSGVGQTAVTSIDGVETLDTRLVLGAYGESEGAVYGFAFETNDNLDDVELYDAHVGADFGMFDVTVGYFKRHFSHEMTTTKGGYGLGLTRSSTYGLIESRAGGASFGFDVGEVSFNFDIVGDDVFDGDTVTYGGRVELGALGFGFVGEEMDLWTVDISDGYNYLSYTDNNGDWTAVGQSVLFTVEDTFSGYGRVEYDHLDETTFAVGAVCEFQEGVSALVEYDDRDEGVRAGLRFTF